MKLYTLKPIDKLCIQRLMNLLPKTHTQQSLNARQSSADRVTVFVLVFTFMTLHETVAVERFIDFFMYLLLFFFLFSLSGTAAAQLN